MPAHRPSLIAPADAHHVERPDTLGWLLRASVAWFFVYLVLQGQDGFFAVTVERVDATWVKASFLNVPLHLGLTLLAALCAGARRPGARRAALALAWLNAALIAGHVVLSFATA